MFTSKYYDEYKIQEGHLSRKSLRGMRFAALAVIVCGPMFFAQTHLPVEWKIRGLIGMLYIGVQILLLLSFLIGLVFMAGSSIASRLFTPDKYLDEWELEHKKNALSFTWWCFSILALFAFVISLGLEVFLDFKKINIQLDIETVFHIVFAFTMLLFALPVLHFVWNLKPLDSNDEG